MNMGDSLVLLVEDSDSQAAAFQAYLKGAQVRVSHAPSGGAAMECLREAKPALVLLDLGLPDTPGLEVLKMMREHGLTAPVVIITDDDSVDTAVKAMRLGADDFITKPCDAQRLRTTVANCLKKQELQEILRSYEETYSRDGFHRLIGRSPAMQAVYQAIANVAASTASVFISGESGTGKELCAQALHKESARADGPFIAINCAAIPRELMESEVFGHVKGAFTGANSDREGAAKLADGGTLFLDEICEMSLDLQAKLLRFIQTGTFRRVGSSQQQSVDIRFVAATNRDPLSEVAAGRFREDLYYRLHVVPISMPPLRDRDQDILQIARRFLERFSRDEGKDFRGFTPRAEELLHGYGWPGNVRELENAIRNIVVLNRGAEVTAAMLPASLSQRQADRADSPLNLSAANSQPATVSEGPPDSAVPLDIEPLSVLERRHIERAIQACAGSIPKAAALLGVSPSTIYRKRQAWAAG